MKLKTKLISKTYSAEMGDYKFQITITKDTKDTRNNHFGIGFYRDKKTGVETGYLPEGFSDKIWDEIKKKFKKEYTEIYSK